MIDLIIDVSGSNRLVARLEALPAELRERLAGPIRRITDEMLARVQAAEPYRTGALRAATREFVDQRDNSIRGRVRVLSEPGGPDHNIKAGALDYGAHRLIDVAAGETHDAYQRDVNITALRFLQDAVGGVQAEFEAAVELAIAEVTREF